MNNYFNNYDKLVERVDELCIGIERRLSESLECRAGCSSCCIPITIFPVEAYALKRSFLNLSEYEREIILRQVEGGGALNCPLLKDERCLMYQARPIICRTHGLPILYREDGDQKIDCCPKNRFSGVTLTGSDLLDLDRLNSLLVAINSVYRTEISDATLPARMSITEAILLHEK